jgi:predicted dehydrogenase
VTLPRRFTPYARTIHESLSAGHLGREGLVRIHRWERDEHEQRATSRSQLGQLLSEEIDLTCWLFDASPTSIFGQVIQSGDAETGIHCHLGFADGMALIDCAFHDGEPYYSASLIGSRGAAYADDHHNTNLLFRKHTEGRRVSHGHDWWRLQLDSFAGSVELGIGDTSISDLRRAMLARDVAVESATADRSAKLVGAQYELQ